MIFFVFGGAWGATGCGNCNALFYFFIERCWGPGGGLGAEIAMIRRQVAGCQLKLDKVPA